MRAFVSAGRSEDRYAAVALARMAAPVVPSGAASRCRRVPQNQRHWAARLAVAAGVSELRTACDLDQAAALHRGGVHQHDVVVVVGAVGGETCPGEWPRAGGRARTGASGRALSRSTPTTSLPTSGQLCEAIADDAAGRRPQRSQAVRDRRSAWVLWLPVPGQHRVRERLTLIKRPLAERPRPSPQPVRGAASSRSRRSDAGRTSRTRRRA